MFGDFFNFGAFLAFDRKRSNFLFWIVTKLTAIMLVTIAILATASNFAGKSISCDFTDPSAHRASFVEDFCWKQGKYTRKDPKNLFEAKLGVEHSSNPTEIVRQPVYQWTSLVLFLFGFLCATPCFFNMLEGGLLDTLLRNLCPNPEQTKEEREEKKRNFIYFFRNEINANRFTSRYWQCETLALAIVLGLFAIVNYFLGGLNVFSYTEEEIEKAFPSQVKCNVEETDPSGLTSNIDAICNLPINDFYQKIFLFLWYWFGILAALLSVQFFYRLMLLLVPSIRPMVLRRLCSSNSADLNEAIQSLSFKLTMGEFYVLYRIGQILEGNRMFQEIVLELLENTITMPRTECLD